MVRRFLMLTTLSATVLTGCKTTGGPLDGMSQAAGGLGGQIIGTVANSLPGNVLGGSVANSVPSGITSQAFGALQQQAGQAVASAARSISEGEAKRTAEQNLEVYSGENRTGSYILQGSIYGALAGAVAGCGVNLAQRENCTNGIVKYALGGAAIGGLGGYLVANSEERARKRAVELNSDIQRAEVAIAEATLALDGATVLTERHQQRIAQLSSDIALGRSTQADLNRELIDARGNLESMRNARFKLANDLTTLRQQRSNAVFTDDAERQTYNQAVQELARQTTDLDTEIGKLAAAVGDAERQIG